MIDLDNQTNLNFELEILEKIALEVTNRDFELLIVNNDTIRRLNKEHRNKDKATDVLSFPFNLNFEYAPLGSIIISADFVKAKAKEFNHKIEDELQLLFIHGLLHLLGYDHETDSGEHRSKEEELIKKFNLPKSLIVRNS